MFDRVHFEGRLDRSQREECEFHILDTSKQALNYCYRLKTIELYCSEHLAQAEPYGGWALARRPHFGQPWFRADHNINILDSRMNWLEVKIAVTY